MKHTTRSAMPNIVEWMPPSALALAKVFVEPDTKYYRFGGCSVILSHTDKTGWHLSISCKNRYPTWDEIAHARYTLIPDNVLMAMLLPPEEDYVNLNPNTFHLWEIPMILMEKMTE